MGVWGTSLYSGDFATDLRSTIAALSRLPFDPDRLIEILRETEPAAADDPRDEDHTTFWLVVADQFAKRGFASALARETALRIIDSGQDDAMHRARGMTDADLGKRSRMLQELRSRIVADPVPKPRSILKKPQPLLMDVGDVLVYPTLNGENRNPYLSSARMNARPWVPDGWGAAVIIDCGRTFGFLSWYRTLTLAEARNEKPDSAFLQGEVLWTFELPGTCSPAQFKKMQLEKIDTLPIDAGKLATLFPGMRPGDSAAISDVSLGNRLHAAPFGSNRFAGVRSNTERPYRTTLIMGLEQILQRKGS